MAKKESVIKELALFYPRLLAGLFTMILTAAAGIALAAIVVYPLWSTATHSKTAYNWFILICVALALIIIPAVRIRALNKAGLSAGEIIRKHIIPVIVRIIYFFLLFMSAVLAWMFFANNYIPGGICSIIFILLITGIFKIYLKK
ncbi:MAG: hypothetical protein J6W33_06465 [Spirochaetia bacterium]|nr:hypothetical protein [Spirochaetia bacterium]